VPLVAVNEFYAANRLDRTERSSTVAKIQQIDSIIGKEKGDTGENPVSP
jgi:hypothetical protein